MILAVANQKGGVGKTTTAINLGAAIGALEKRVLIVDCDPQGNATRGLGATATPPHLYHVLTGEATLVEATRPTGFPNLDLVPANRDLVGVEVEFVGVEGWEGRLRDAVREDDHDLVLLDCPPSLGLLTLNTLVAADSVLIPIQCEFYALEGLSQLLNTVRLVQKGLNPDLEIEGVLLTMYDRRLNLSRQVADEAREYFGERVYRSTIPRNVTLAEAPSFGQPIIQYDVLSVGAQGYLSLAREVIDREAPATTGGEG